MLASTQTYSHVVPSAAELDKNIIKSAHRALEVFEFFASAGRPASATEIANVLGYPQSSTSMLLRSLVALGYLDYHRDERSYEPTLRLSLLGGWIPQRIDIARHIIETMNNLHEEFAETVLLAVQYRHYVRYIYAVQKPEPGISYHVRPGILRPATATATGLALLTLNSDRDVQSILNRINADQHDPGEWLRRQDLFDRLEQTRRDGYAYHERELDAWIGVQVAVLLPPGEGSPRMALGVLSRRPRYKQRENEILSRLLEISRGQ
ncbi:helix-turn-helix domain-containing protein [Phenylobacterium sp.]|uniref:IclR family transcriptional regulator n=1 Tax=Phenylobacterium sp. TaxID=1871053 RepID=UPI00301BFFC4